MDELLDFIDKQDKRLLEYYGESGKEEILARMAKLTEEVGELSSEVLAINGRQRKEALGNFNKDSLCGEFADVIFTTLLLAKSLDIDIRKALELKIKKIEERPGKI